MKDGIRQGRARSARVCSVLALALCACTDEIDNPSAGQTGSPVSPDHESPVPFRPPPRNPPGNGADNPRPWRPLPGTIQRAASFGDWLYVSTPRGLFAFDTGVEGATPVPVLDDVNVQWLRVEGSTLDLVVEGFPDDPAEFGEALVTRVQRFELAADPARPALLGSVELPGRFLRARGEGERLVTLTGDPGAARCRPEVGLQGSYEPERMIVSELALGADGWSVAREVAAEATGFVETENAFVLTGLDASLGNWGMTVTVVELTPEGIAEWPALSFKGEVAPRAAMAVAGRRLALFQINDESLRLELAIYDGDTGAKLGAIEVGPDAIWSNVDSARFEGRFVLLPWTRGDELPGQSAIVDWQAPGGPLTVGVLPADLLGFERIGERWLGRGAERYALFHLDDGGQFQLDAEADVPAEAAGPGQLIQVGTTLLQPYVVDGREQRLARVEVGNASLSWSAGPSLTGSPGTYVLTGLYMGVQPGSSFVESGHGQFALTIAGDISNAHWLLERIDLGAEQSEVVAFAERSLAAVAHDDDVAALRVRHDGTRLLRVTDGGGTASELALSHRVERLARSDTDWIAFGLEYDDGCVPDLTSFADAPCAPASLPGIGRVSLSSSQLLDDTALPLPTSPDDPREVYWLELVAQGGQVGLLRDQRDSTSQYQRWLYPFDGETSTFGAPVHLFDVDGYSWLSAENLRVDADAGAALGLFTAVGIDRYDYEVELARIELVRYRDLSSAALAEPTRITVPGYPLYVGARRAVTIEPAGALGSNGEAPAVLVHRLALDGEVAYVEQTLELGSGASGYRWADQRGYVLLVADDRCAEPTSTLVSVRLVGDRLEEAGRVTLPGTSWRLAEVSDSLALLVRGTDALVQHALIDAAGTELSLREYRVHHQSVPVSVSGERVWFETAP
jgi:hypothetical protein